MMHEPRTAVRSRRVLGAMVLALALVACERNEAEVRPPEMAEVERDDGEVEFEEAFPLDTDDIGDEMLVSGAVVGKPGPAGFFVRVEGNRVVFVDSPDTVTTGQRVRAVGPLRAIDATTFAGWERDWLGDIDPVWLVARLYFVDADSVRKL